MDAHDPANNDAEVPTHGTSAEALEGKVWGSASLDALLAGLQPAERMLDFYESRLGALRAYDRDHHADLIRTLEAYFSSGGSLAATAAVLQTHRNTVLYRLRRIEALSRARLRDPRVALDFQVVLRIGTALNR